MINLRGCAGNGNFMRIALIPMSRGGENCNPWTCGWVMMALMVLGLVFAGELLGSVNVGQTLGDSEIWAPSITPCPLAPLLTVFTSPHNLWAQITDCLHQTEVNNVAKVQKRNIWRLAAQTGWKTKQVGEAKGQSWCLSKLASRG